MLTAIEQLRHLADCVTEAEAEAILRTDTARHLLCPISASCPACGQRALDFLAWTEDDCLHCGTCGTTYDPNGAGTSAAPPL